MKLIAPQIFIYKLNTVYPFSVIYAFLILINLGNLKDSTIAF